jgi:hypothetical protein
MSTWTSNLNIQLIGTGEQAGTWGTTTNGNWQYVMEEAIVGSTTVTFSDADVTLSSSQSTTDQQYRNLVLNCSGTNTQARNLIVPTIYKNYLVANNTTGGFAITVKTASGTGISVPNGSTAFVYANGTNVIQAFNYQSSLTLGTALPVSSGGTGVTSSSGASSVVLRDSNGNITANSLFQGFQSISASGSQVTLLAASAPNILVTGSGGQVIQLPNATTLSNNATFTFNNNQSAGAITVNNNSGTQVVSVPSGGFVTVILDSNAIAAGAWDYHASAPSSVSWSTNTLSYSGAITNATWNGSTVGVSYGGTGTTTSTGSGSVVLNTSPNITGLTVGVSASVSAAGTNQATATALTSDVNVITTAASGTGVVLPTATVGRQVSVVNRGLNAVAIYPAGTAQIDALGASTSISLPVNGLMFFDASTTTQWYSSYNLNTSGSGGGSVTIVNDVATSSAVYPLVAHATSGTASTVYTANSEYLFTPSTGALQAKNLLASNGIILNSTTVSTTYAFPSGYNGRAVGPLTVASGATLTVTSGSRFIVN